MTNDIRNFPAIHLANRRKSSVVTNRLVLAFIYFVFSIRVFFSRHWRFRGQQRKGGDHLYYFLLLSPAHNHSDIYLQLYKRDDYHIFSFVSLITTKLLLDEIYHFTELHLDLLMMECWLGFMLDRLFLGFLLQRFEIQNQWIWTRIDHHPSITSKATNQMG